MYDSPMIVLSGADLVLADRITGPSTLVIDEGRIVEIRPGAIAGIVGAGFRRLDRHLVVPGFIDTHIHGVAGRDLLDGPDALAAIAAHLPRFGVTAFCPTTIACPPASLRLALDAVRAWRLAPLSGSARVLPAHLESNFLHPDYRGAQPAWCLRHPPHVVPANTRADALGGAPRDDSPIADGSFTADDILAEIDRAGADVGAITIAPDLPGAVEFTAALTARGHIVSLGHSGATYDQGLAAIDAGARRGTHLFNRMPPLGHRAPGLAGAILHRPEAIAEVVADGHHVHPAMVAMVVSAKGPAGVMAVTDGTAGSGLPVGSRVTLGSQSITVRDTAAYMDDDTLAGSVLTMDAAFRRLVALVGLSPVEAALLCSTTPARHLGMVGYGVLARGAVADLVVLDSDLRPVETYIDGRLAWMNPGRAPVV